MTLFTKSIEKYGTIIPYIQYLIIYHIKLFLYPSYREIYKTVLNKSEQRDFIHSYINILKHIDTQYINEQDMPIYYKEFMFFLKDENTEGLKKIKKEKIYQSSCTITKAKIKGWKLELTGHFINQYYEMQESDFIYVKYFKTLKNCKRKELKKSIEVWGYKLRDFKYAGFVVEIPIWAVAFEFILKTSDGSIKLNHVNIFRSLLVKSFKR